MIEGGGFCIVRCFGPIREPRGVCYAKKVTTRADILSALGNFSKHHSGPSLESFEPEISESIRYLGSSDALERISLNPYWPKWGSAWWQMSVLYEMGLVDRIPTVVANAMLESMADKYLPIFFPADFPPGKNASEHGPCHCSLGNMYQILRARGLDVDAKLPWARDFFLRYQLPDGGLNCDDSVYFEPNPAGSIVGTIAPLEALLFFPRGKLTPGEEIFIDRGAENLLARNLLRGSHPEERLDEDDWRLPTFPRFYFYDTLRGLHFILRWAELRSRKIPIESVSDAVLALAWKFPTGDVRSERESTIDAPRTLDRNASGVWERGFPAGTFPLLEKLRASREYSPWLSSQWFDCVRRLRETNVLAG